MKSAVAKIRISVLATVCTLAPQAAFAEATWKSLEAAGDKLQKEMQYVPAAQCYEKALKAVPQQELAARVKMEVLVATDYLKNKQHDKGLEHGNTVVKLCEQIKASGGMKSDVKALVLMLTMMCSNPKFPANATYEYKHSRMQKLSALEVELKKAIGGTAKGQFSNRFHVARGFVALGDDKQAQAELEKMLPTFPEGEAHGQELRAALAAMKKKHGDPTMHRQMFKELSQRHSKAFAYKVLGGGEFWAADYDAGKASVAAGLKAMDRTRDKPSLEVELLMLNTRLCLDVNDFAGAEPCLERAIKISPQCNIDKVEIAMMERLLGSCYREQKKTSAVQTMKRERELRGSKKQMHLLSDEEMAKLRAQVKAKPARKH
jgi:tetratricopeptide (TPR) repeat protein